MNDKEGRKLTIQLINILREKKIINDKDMEKMFGKPEEFRLLDCYKL